MESGKQELLKKRNDGFDDFYDSMLSGLVEFVDVLGISPPHEVLKHAVQFVPLVAQATHQMPVESGDHKVWFVTRMTYFVGEVFVQKFGGCWFVNDAPESRYFARYVVGQFKRDAKSSAMIDPYEIALAYVDGALPRDLEALLGEVEVALRAY